MAKDDRLRPKPVPAPPPGPGQLPASQLPGPGRPPLRTGEVYMSDYTKAQLGKLGWKPGDPIPGDLGTEISRIQKEMQEDLDTANWENNPPPGYKKPKHELVDIDTLPPEKQAQLREYLADYKSEMQQAAQMQEMQENAESQQPSNLSPAMQEATRRAAAQTAEATVGRGSFIDDRPSVPEGLDVPEGKQFGGVLGDISGMQKIQQLKKLEAQRKQSQPQPGKPTVEEDPEPASAHSHIGPLFCPRCLWDQKEPFEIHPTQEDKEMFIAAILGLARFEKKYELLGGNCVVYYRSLLSDEVAKLNEQLGWHIRRGEIMGDGEYYMWLMEYRMVMATSRIETGGQVLKNVITLEEFEKEHPDSFGKSSANPDLPPTALYAMRSWYYKTIATIEPIRRVIGQEHRVFQRLLEGLEAMADKPDFWTRIERRA